jgi:AbrB family looped-hinge helix DNA binding protein
MKAKVAERGQVTIPKELRERLGIVPGTVLDFFEEQGLLIARTVRIGFSAINYETAMGAARSWHGYRRRGGGHDRSAADFLIGGHASVQAERLLTRDLGFYRNYFTGLAVVSP